MAGISKIKYKYKGKEVDRYRITYRDIYGKQHTSKLYKTKNEAKRDLHLYDNIDPESDNVTFGQIFTSFLDKAEAKYSHTTVDNYKRYAKNHFSSLYDVRYNKVSSLDLERLISNIEKNHSPYVAQLSLKLGKAAVNYAIKHNLVKTNKFNSVTKVVINSNDNKAHLSEEEEKRVLEACRELYPAYTMLFHLLMGTGMRIGEVLALERDVIDLENSKILVNKQYTKGKLKHKPKGHSNNREVYLMDDLVEALRKHLETLPCNTKLIFPSQVNSYMNDTNIRERVWRPLLAYVGINKRVRIHDLRGSYVDIAISHGASLKFVQNQLGHSKSQLTLDVYNKNSSDIINSSLERLNGAFSY